MEKIEYHLIRTGKTITNGLLSYVVRHYYGDNELTNEIIMYMYNEAKEGIIETDDAKDISGLLLSTLKDFDTESPEYEEDDPGCKLISTLLKQICIYGDIPALNDIGDIDEGCKVLQDILEEIHFTSIPGYWIVGIRH